MSSDSGNPTADPATGPSEPVLFEAVLYPHRSLSPRGFLFLMAAISLVCFTAGIVFWAMGAWPVFGFFGLDVALVYFAFRLNFRRARLYETVRLTASRLRVERVEPSGRKSHWDFQPYWTRVEIDDPPGHDSPLALMSKGRRLVIGGFLNGCERFDFACVLRQALAENVT